MPNSIATMYRHTQRGPWSFVIYAIAASALIAAFIAKDNLARATPFLIAAFALGFAGACFHHLTVEDEADRLKIRFGPLPLFRRSIHYEDIQNVVVSRTRFFDGWGIHYSIRGGWVWNIWGRDCVLIELPRGRKLWLGTDDAEELCRFLQQKLVLKRVNEI